MRIFKKECIAYHVDNRAEDRETCDHYKNDICMLLIGKISCDDVLEENHENDIDRH